MKLRVRLMLALRGKPQHQTELEYYTPSPPFYYPSLADSRADSGGLQQGQQPSLKLSGLL